MYQINQCRILFGFLTIFIFNNNTFPINDGKYISFDVEAAVIEKPGCYHNGSLYADGSFVPTLEPCLNCKCKTKTLICSLKICPEMPVPPPRGCILVHKKNTCCPYLSCLRLHDYYNNALSRRIASYLDHYEKESIDRVVNENFLQKRSDDDDFDGVGEICVKNGTVYKSGSAMSSSSLCSYCYCIGGQQRCVKPKCMLPLEGCKPIFVDSTCCPVRYDCGTKSAGRKSWRDKNKKETNNKHYQRMSETLQRNRGCHYVNQFYLEGQKMFADNNKPCDICFCIRGKRKCTLKKCAPALRSCIPVIPKGQCCPSSYDCGSSIREWDRAYQSRQIGLFSWILGSENDPTTNNSTVDSSAMAPYTVAESMNSIKTTSEKSIFEVIREGLQMIDANGSSLNNEIKNPNETPHQVNNIATTISLVNLPSLQNNVLENNVRSNANNHKGNEAEGDEDEEKEESGKEEDEDDINLFDLFLQTVTNVTRSNATTATTTTTKTISNPTLHNSPFKNEDSEDYEEDYDGVNFFDIFLGQTAKNSAIENSTTSEPYNFDYFELFNDNDNATYDYLGVSHSTIKNDSTSNEENQYTEELSLSTTNSIEARSEIIEDDDNTEKYYEIGGVNVHETTTFKPNNEQTIQSNEEKIGTDSGEDFDSEERNLSTLSNENYSTEDVQVSSFSTEDDSMEELSTINDEFEKNHETTTILNQNSKLTTISSIKNLPTKLKSYFRSTTPSSISIDSSTLTTKIILNKTSSNVLVKKNKTEENPIIRNKMSFLSTVIDELQSLIRKNSNVTTAKPIETNSNINYKNFTATVPPFKNILMNSNLNQIFKKTSTTKPVLAQRTTTKLNITKMKLNNTTVIQNRIDDKSVKTTRTTLLPNYVILKTITTTTLKPQLIAHVNDQTENEDYGHNTLPPSLPNLEIIPFLPIDALPIKEKLAPAPTYPVITERYGSGENIWPDLIDDSRPFEDLDSVLPSLTYMNSKLDSFNDNSNHNGFSPPIKTEGGFLPKQPIIDDNLYYGTKLTTITQPSLDVVTKSVKKFSSTEQPIAITSTDPFRDVIKTESPPHLVLLIEDKEKQLLANKQSNSYEDEQIIHITTDSNYNSDLKQDSAIEFNNVNFENIRFTESNYVLSENFPLDRHENASFTEKNPNDIGASEMLQLNQKIHDHLIVQPVENDVLAESFPLDRHDDYKKINNLTYDNVVMMVDHNDDTVNFGSFLDYFLGGTVSITNQNQTIQNTSTPISVQTKKTTIKMTPSTTTKSKTTIPPFKVIPSNLSLFPKINSETINDQLQSNVNYSTNKYKHKNITTDLSILGELLNSNNRRIGESVLYESKLQRPFSLPNITKSVDVNNNKNSIPDPFKGLPGLIPSYQIKRPSETKPIGNDIDVILTQIQKEPYTVGAYKIIQNQTEFSKSGPYVVNPIDIDELKKTQQQQQQQNDQQQQYQRQQQQKPQQLQNDIHAEIFSKPENLNSINDPAGLLKLAGCNIYGRMYRVGRIISELSNACLECKCTEIGVSCMSLKCYE